MSDYLAYSFDIWPKEPASEILIAELGLLGFESFQEDEKGLKAYIKKKDLRPELMDDLSVLKNPDFEISYSKEEITSTNWNSEWEKNFKPIAVDQRVYIRAPFHPATDLEFDIIIEPKMSFGTGHHETTHMMVQHMLAMDLHGKKVLDMGCGTGVLAIFAEKKGAHPIDAIDIDPWCYENSLENCKRNNCRHIRVLEGDASLLNDMSYDLIIANINRNILLRDMSIYHKCLVENGKLLLSGFYTEDQPLIDDEATKYGLKLLKTLEKNNWAAVKYVN